MPFDLESFSALCEKISSIDLHGTSLPLPPWGSRLPNRADLSSAIAEGSALLPPAYQAGYAQPLRDQLARIEHLARHTTGFAGTVETMIGAVHQQGEGYPHAAALRRFLAVVSDLYRSFLSADKRTAAGVRLSELLPPLATFKYQGDQGPFTIPVEGTKGIFGGSIGVVSMPAVYRDHPLLWGSLTHEAGGHDVVHADDGLLDELRAVVLEKCGARGAARGGKASDEQLLGAVWAYWMDEAAADVYGLLNMGPAYAFNLAALFSGLNNRGRGGGPCMRTETGASAAHGDLDCHPTDILRLGLAAGVIDSLRQLSPKTRQAYGEALRQLTALCAGSATTVRLEGAISLGAARLHVATRQPLKKMLETARGVGRLIATTRLQALGGRGIQEIETWDDGDERAAATIDAALTAGQPIVGLGDAAQVLAGMTHALSRKPALYDAATGLVNDALDASYHGDPIFGAPAPDPIFVRQQHWNSAPAATPLARPSRRRAAR